MSISKEFSANFRADLRDLINLHGIDTDSNMPDHKLANYMLTCLSTFNKTISDKVCSCENKSELNKENLSKAVDTMKKLKFQEQDDTKFINGLVEKLSDLAHQQWSGWMTYLFKQGKFNNKDGGFTINESSVTHWLNQINIHYNDLTESEKASDRKEAYRVLEVIEDYTYPDKHKRPSLTEIFETDVSVPKEDPIYEPEWPAMWQPQSEFTTTPNNVEWVVRRNGEDQ